MGQLNPWINDARADIGKYHDGPDVPMLATRIATRFPDLASYCRLAKPDTQWCGIMVAEWLSRYGIRPPYTPPGNNEGSFMFADSYADTSWGTRIPIGQEQPGDIAVFRSPHHVTMVSINGKFVGGNQSDGVTETSFNRSGLRAIIRPPAANEAAQSNTPKPQQPKSAPVPLNPKLSNFAKCLPLLLKHEGGNDDDPRDPGGRTSRGILQREWDVWRASHPGLPSDVWQAPDDEIEAIYKQKYWDVLQCDELPSGVDYAVFDYGVNSGNSRAAKVLQRLVGVDADGEIGPLTIGATLPVDPKSLIEQICDERLAFLESLHTWPIFGRGWSSRVSEVRAAAEAMTTLPKLRTTPNQPSPTTSVLAEIHRRLGELQKVMTGTAAPVAMPVPPVTPMPVPMPAPMPGWPIDMARIEMDIARLGQAAATFSAIANHIGQFPTAGLPPQIAQAEQTIARLGQVAGTLSQYTSAVTGPAPGTSAGGAAGPKKEPLSPIDKVLGGEALVGVKTPLAIAGYALIWILQTLGTMGTATGDKATTTGAVMTTLVAAFGALGVTAKFDRAFGALSTIAGLMRKLPALMPPPPPPLGGALN